MTDEREWVIRSHPLVRYLGVLLAVPGLAVLALRIWPLPPELLEAIPEGAQGMLMACAPAGVFLYCWGLEQIHVTPDKIESRRLIWRRTVDRHTCRIERSGDHDFLLTDQHGGWLTVHRWMSGAAELFDLIAQESAARARTDHQYDLPRDLYTQRWAGNLGSVLAPKAEDWPIDGLGEEPSDAALSEILASVCGEPAPPERSADDPLQQISNLVKADKQADVAKSRQVVFRRHPIRFPNRCISCSGPAETTVELSSRKGVYIPFVVHVFDTLKVSVPVCQSCRRRRQRSGLSGAVLLVAVVAVFVSIQAFSGAEFWNRLPKNPVIDGVGLVIVGILVIAAFLSSTFSGRLLNRSALGVNCIDFDRRKGSVTLWFRDGRLADEIARLNRPKPD